MTRENTMAPAIDDHEEAARGILYGTLASLVDEPSKARYQTLSDGSMSADLETLVDRSGLDVAVPVLETTDDYELLCARFNDIFEIGYPDPPIPLYESEHIQDGSWDDINLDLARAYEYFGVTVDDSEREHHDHLQLELEFVGYLARLSATQGDANARHARRDFLDRHLAPFVQSVGAAIEDEVETEIYGELIDFMETFVTTDLSDLDARVERGVASQ